MEDKNPTCFFIDGNEKVERETMEGELAVAFHTDPLQGNILKIGNSIYFLKYWPDAAVEQAHNVIEEALLAEARARGWEIVGE